MGRARQHPLLQSPADRAAPAPCALARTPPAVQVAVALVQRCEADLLRMTDFEEMVRRLGQRRGRV